MSIFYITFKNFTLLFNDKMIECLNVRMPEC